MNNNKITGTNIYGYKIIPDGYEISQLSGRNKFTQNFPLNGITEVEWQKEEVRIKAASEKVLSLNTDLLNAARIVAKKQIQKACEVSTGMLLEDEETKTSWDATFDSAMELICSQIVYQNSNMPITIYDAFNKEVKFDSPKSQNGEFKILPIISKIAFSAIEKRKKKYSLYAKLYDMYDIDELLRFNPYEKFGLTKEQVNAYNTIKEYF